MAEAGHGPTDIFLVKRLVEIRTFDLDLSFTNAALWMVLAATLAVTLLSVGLRRRALVPNRWQALSELMYEAVAGMVRENVGKEGKEYFPFIFSLFLFILFGNLLGLIPGSYTFTSQLIVTFALAAFIFVAVTVIGFWKHGTGYLAMFFPHGAPLWTAPILIPIELVSYLSRPVSLSVRLFANMTVGHLMLHVIGGFVVIAALPLAGQFVIGTLSLAALVAITALELMIAVIQAYVFTVLTCIYLNDALHPHH